MSFKPYKKPKYTKAYGSTYMLQEGSYAELCKVCGYPLGEHSGVNTCPGEGMFTHTPPMGKQFYSESLNVNTIVL